MLILVLVRTAFALGQAEYSSDTDSTTRAAPPKQFHESTLLVEAGLHLGSGSSDDVEHPLGSERGIGDIYTFHTRGCLYSHKVGVVPVIDVVREYFRAIESPPGSEDYRERSIQLYGSYRVFILKNRWEVRPLVGYGWNHEEFRTAPDTDTSTHRVLVRSNMEGICTGLETDLLIAKSARFRGLFTHAAYDEVHTRLMVELRFYLYATDDLEWSGRDSGLSAAGISFAYSPSWHGSGRTDHFVLVGLSLRIVN